ncbi:unnamed protein product [Ostreobium quekettii]|uniref:Uncharacterized protein n=1 Tax=Ostreobium quekettii TaxID=121088 RepID=A0A8S1J9I3_9CHLO|nr:unnamed protein product [Ostreobium quekettii]
MLYDGERLQIIVVDSCGYLAIYCLKKGRMLVSKRLTKHPIVSIYQRMECKDIIVVTTSEIQAWRIDRDVGYNLLRGGHSGPVISLYTCSGGLATPNETDFRLFTASLDNTVRLWDPYDLQCLRVIEETESELSAMTFCETLNLLITGLNFSDYEMAARKLSTMRLLSRKWPEPAPWSPAAVQGPLLKASSMLFLVAICTALHLLSRGTITRINISINQLCRSAGDSRC